MDYEAQIQIQETGVRSTKRDCRDGVGEIPARACPTVVPAKLIKWGGVKKSKDTADLVWPQDCSKLSKSSTMETFLRAAISLTTKLHQSMYVLRLRDPMIPVSRHLEIMMSYLTPSHTLVLWPPKCRETYHYGGQLRQRRTQICPSERPFPQKTTTKTHKVYTCTVLGHLTRLVLELELIWTV